MLRRLMFSFAALVLLVLGALSAQPAHAQASAPVSIDAPCIFRSLWTPTGSGSDWVHGTEQPVTRGGVSVSWWAWWCPNTDGTWRPYIIRCVEGRTCLSARAVGAELDTAARSADRLDALRAAVRKYQSAPLASELNDWDFARVAALQALEKIKPAPPGPVRWVAVAPLSVYTTQNGALARVVLGKKAPAGAACSGAPIVVGTVVYMAFTGGAPGEVTTCKASP